MQNITLDQLRGTAVFTQAIKELDSQRVSERAQLAKELDECFASGSAARIEADKCLAAERALAEEFEQLMQRKGELEQERFNAREKAMRLVNKATIARRGLEDRLRASCDVRIHRFIVWAHRAANLANNASFVAPPLAIAAESPKVLASAEGMSASSATAIAKVRTLVNASVSRAEAMMLEAESFDDIGLELEAMASSIFTAYSGVNNARSMPRDYLADLH